MGINLHNDPIRLHAPGYGPDHNTPMLNPACMCNTPLMISVPAGQHFHPCPVHRDRAVYSSAPISMMSPWQPA